MATTYHDVDRGWAWLVLCAVYFGILLLSTSLYTAGVMYVALLDYYNEDAAKTSIIGALNQGFLCLMGKSFILPELAQVSMSIVTNRNFSET